eukprot:GGOE01005517.1.p1 GENE.GGOE01005517.1~~GGOE01005517.1.p1  ORF type:complete len:316 (+),score=92.55 GGOE01005517.1:45-992(+)
MGDEQPAVCGTFDWLVEFEDLQDLLNPDHTFQPYDTQVLVIGCGNSTLSAAMHAAGYALITSIDIDVGIVEEMKARHVDSPTLRWLCLDIGEVHGALDTSSVGLAVDKGTLDAMLCGELIHVAKYLSAVWEVLVPDGVLLIVSLYPRSLLTALLTLPGDPYTIAHTYLPHKMAWCEAVGGQTKVSVATLRKSLHSHPPDQVAVTHHLQAALDDFTRLQNPLLTPEVRARIESRFSARLATRPTPCFVAVPSLPLVDIYEVLFEDQLREGYPYDAFLADWEAYQHECDPPADADADGGGDRGLTLSEALRFVEVMQ